MSTPRPFLRSFPQTPPRVTEAFDDRFIGVAHSGALAIPTSTPPSEIRHSQADDDEAQYRSFLQERMGLNGTVLHFDPARQSRLPFGAFEANGVKLHSPCQDNSLLPPGDTSFHSTDESSSRVPNGSSTPRASTPQTTESDLWSSPLSLRSPPPLTRTPISLRSPARDLTGSPFQSTSPPMRLTTPGGSRSRAHRDLTASRVLDGVGAASDPLCHILAFGSLSLIVALDSIVYEWSKKGDDDPVVSRVMEARCKVTSVAASTSPVVTPYYIAVGLDNGLMHVFRDDRSGRTSFIVNELQHRVSSLHIHQNLLYCGTVDGMCIVAALVASASSSHEAVQVQRRFDIGFSVCSIDVTSDGNHIAIGHSNGVDIYHRTQMATPLRITTHQRVRALSWGSSALGLGTLIYGVGDAMIVRSINSGSIVSKETGRNICALVCSKTSGEVIVSFDSVPTPILRASPQDEEWLVKFDVLEGRIRRVAGLHGHGKRCIHAVLSPNGRTLVTASDDDTVRFWDVFDGFSDDRGGYTFQNFGELCDVERSLFSAPSTGDLR